MLNPTLPNLAPYDRVAVRVPMLEYHPVKCGDMLYVIQQDFLETLVEEARTGIRYIIKTLDLEPWTR